MICSKCGRVVKRFKLHDNVKKFEAVWMCPNCYIIYDIRSRVRKND